MNSSKKSILSVLLVSALFVFLITGCSGPQKGAADSAAAPVSASLAALEKALSSSPSQNTGVELTISAAASLKDVASEIAENYKTIAPNVKLTYAFGSSGALQKQIEQGAPVDIFFSAAKKQMTVLREKKLVEESAIKDLLTNEIVLITHKDSTKEIKTFEDITTHKVKIVALGDPASVPAGQYSEEVFNFLKVLDKVKQKANYGSDVRQVLTWVENDQVDCGVVYATDAVTSDKVKVVCEAPKDSHETIVYPIAVLKNSKHSKEAQNFVDYLSSESVKYVFKKYGFGTK